MDDQEVSVRGYMQMALRRKWWIILPFLTAVLISFAYYKNLPKIYRTSTLILVQPQKIPESYVRTTITASISDQLSTISQEILSRTRLERIIQDVNPYPDLKDTVPAEDIVEKMRRSIEVNLQSRSPNGGQNAFSISFEGEDPKMITIVTNQLASLFIQEHLKVRELQAEGTSSFLMRELAVVEKELLRKERDLKAFRERNMGKLPQQLEANLGIFGRLQQQLQTTHMTLKTAEDRVMILQSQMEQLKKSVTPPHSLLPSGKRIVSEREPVPEKVENPLNAQLNQLKRELKNARSRYTENHPDIMELKRKIETLEPEALAEKEGTQREARQRQKRAQEERRTESEPVQVPPDPMTERLLLPYREQYTSARLEVERIKAEEVKLKEDILLYQKRIEDTPKLEQELLSLNRDYDLLKATYQSLMDKKIQSQMAENLERKQQGEQFKVLDPARFPERPIKPDRNRILLMGMGIGFLVGMGLAWFRESLDQTFHLEEDLEADLGLPILAIIPNLREEKSLARRR